MNGFELQSEHISFSQEATQKLLKPLLKEGIFFDKNLIYALSCYPFLNDKGKIDLIRTTTKEIWPFKEQGQLNELLANFELLLRSVNKRDHYIHQFEVFLVGWILIDCIFDNYPLIFAEEKSDVLHMWFVASMCHDIGYTIEHYKTICCNLNDLYSKLGVGCLQSSFSDDSEAYKNCDYLNILNSLSPDGTDVTRLNQLLANSSKLKKDEIDNLITNMQKALDHGYYGALLFLSAMNAMPIDMYTSVKIDNIALSIALHNVHKYDVISSRAKDRLNDIFDIYEHPLPVVLFLIDNIQDWSRSDNITSGWPSFILSDVITHENIVSLNIIIKTDFWDQQKIVMIKEKIDGINSLFAPLSGQSIDVKFEVNYRSVHSLADSKILVNL